MTAAVRDGWWVVRWGQRLTHIEADDAQEAIHGAIDSLRGMGDWTEDPGELSAFRHDVGHGEGTAMNRTLAERLGREAAEARYSPAREWIYGTKFRCGSREGR